MVRLIRTPRVIRTHAQRLQVNRLIEELKNIQPNSEVYKENFVHLVNHIIKFHEKIQDLIWAGAPQMCRSWKKLKVLRKALPTDYQKNILDHLLYKKNEPKQYNDIVHRFVLAYLESLNVKRELNTRELTSSKPGNKIKFPQELYDRFISSFPVRIQYR